MTFAEIRERLAGLEGRKYWRSLEELADTPDFKEYLHREFPAQASEFTDPAGRRQFLKLMGASLALAGVSACTRQPPEKIVPYVRQPEEVIPGRPLFFASAMPHGGYAMPVLVENHLGRPTKIEGNPEHPAGLGATDVWMQASVLSLYDPDRSHNVLSRGDIRTWGAFVDALRAAVGSQRGLRGQGLRILTEPISSPSLLEQMDALLAALPEAKWHQWDPVFGAVQGGAPEAHAVYHLTKADVIVALDADFLGFGPSALRYTKDFAARRRVTTPQDEINRLYAIDPVPTVTGAKADHRLPLKSRDVQAFAAALAAAVGAGGAASGQLPANAAKFVAAVAADLQAHRGKSAVIAGDHQPAAVHALAKQINDALGNTGTTVTYGASVLGSNPDGAASLTDLVTDLNAGKVDVLIVAGTNPVFTAPVDLDFKTAYQKAGLRMHLGLYQDETAEVSHWHAPEAHYLESWGDVRAFEGTVTFTQPLIAPLYDGRQLIEVLALMNGTVASPADLVRDFWTRAYQGKTKSAFSLHDADGKAFVSAEKFWRHALHDGFLYGSTSLTATSLTATSLTATSLTATSLTATSLTAGGSPSPSAGAADAARAKVAAVAPKPVTGITATPLQATLASTPSASMTGTEIVFRPDPMVLDGRYINNGWLQEMPKPLSKVTWDNVAYIGVSTAEKLGIAIDRPGNHENSTIDINYQGRTLRLPVWVLPGTADDTVVVHFGYGSTFAGRVGNGTGFNVYPIRTSKAPWFDGGATIARNDELYMIVSTQNHFAMEGRAPVRAVDTEEYRSNPKAVKEMRETPQLLSLFPPYEYKGHKWGMSIDLNACTGCGVCITACVAENNIAVVGKDQVYRSREMHWIRVDTYYEGNLDNPTTYHQPVPCQQCEDAPCELVCPVAATSHSDEGLNDMVYNRCVGTRYCSNNCPYKVRRFNFMLYSDFTTPELWAQRNPDVTIRSRGVMEKCTYCVQRINHARIDAKTEDREIRDGDIKTACQQACPADAIVFGNLNDPDSKVVKLVKQDRNYSLLEEVGTRPRTTYLAAIKNPNAALKS